MAWVAVTADQIDSIARRLSEASAKLSVAAKKMRDEKFLQMRAQIALAETGAKACSRFANDIDLHLQDQLECRITGQTPIWEQNHRRSALNKARKEAQANADSLGIVKNTPKKTAKKKGT